MKNIDIIILSFNRWQLTYEMVRKLRERTLHPHKIIVVDDGSIQDTVNHLQQMYSSGMVDELHLENHIGYSGSVMRGLGFATTDPFVLSDCDINPPALSTGWLTTLLNRKWDTFSILALNTQLQSSIIMGLDEARLYKGVEVHGSEHRPAKATRGIGITSENLAEVHCAPFWLALVKKCVRPALMKHYFHQYRDHNPDLVYSNILRYEGMPVGIVLDVWGTHTGLGWNKGYTSSVRSGKGYYRPNIPTTTEGIPLYYNMTKEHWYASGRCQRSYVLDDIKYDYQNRSAQRLFVTAIHILHGYVKYPQVPGYEKIFRELCQHMGYSPTL